MQSVSKVVGAIVAVGLGVMIPEQGWAQTSCPISPLQLPRFTAGPAVLKALQGFSRKDEFETTDAYLGRLSSLLGAYGITADQPLAIPVRFGPNAVTYDADAGTLTVEPYVFGARANCSELNIDLKVRGGAAQGVCDFPSYGGEMPAAHVVEIVAEPTEYEATSEGGGKHIVRRERSTTLDVVDTRFGGGAASGSYSPLFQKFKVIQRKGHEEVVDREMDDWAFGPIKLAPEEAKAFKQGGTFVVTFRPKAPFFAKITDTWTPTVMRPVDSEDERYMLIGEIDCVAMVAADGREIAARSVR